MLSALLSVGPPWPVSLCGALFLAVVAVELLTMAAQWLRVRL